MNNAPRAGNVLMPESSAHGIRAPDYTSKNPEGDAKLLHTPHQFSNLISPMRGAEMAVVHLVQLSLGSLSFQFLRTSSQRRQTLKEMTELYYTRQIMTLGDPQIQFIINTA